MRPLSVLLAAFAWALTIGAAAAEKRVAFVVGNGAYRHANPLPNPQADARAMRDTLQGMGFAVVYGEDLDKAAFEVAIVRFAIAARNADVAIAYFAGHGATFDDRPYLVPVDAGFRSLEAVPYELVPMEMILGELRRATGLRIAFFDACRDNGAEQALKRVVATRGGAVNHGLARPPASGGLIVAYATQYLSTASDGIADRNSPFTTALVKHLPTPGLDVNALLRRVGRDVVESTRGAQRPAIENSVFEDYTLVPAAPEPKAVPAPAKTVAPQAALSVPAPVPSPLPAPPAQSPVTPPDLAEWQAVAASTDPARIDALIARYPSSPLRPAWETRLAALRPPPAAAVPGFRRISIGRLREKDGADVYDQAVEIRSQPDGRVLVLSRLRHDCRQGRSYVGAGITYRVDADDEGAVRCRGSLFEEGESKSIALDGTYTGRMSADAAGLSFRGEMSWSDTIAKATSRHRYTESFAVVIEGTRCRVTAFDATSTSHNWDGSKGSNSVSLGPKTVCRLTP